MYLENSRVILHSLITVAFLSSISWLWDQKKHYQEHHQNDLFILQKEKSEVYITETITESFKLWNNKFQIKCHVGTYTEFYVAGNNGCCYKGGLTTFQLMTAKKSLFTMGHIVVLPCSWVLYTGASHVFAHLFMTNTTTATALPRHPAPSASTTTMPATSTLFGRLRDRVSISLDRQQSQPDTRGDDLVHFSPCHVPITQQLFCLCILKLGSAYAILYGPPHAFKRWQVVLPQHMKPGHSLPFSCNFR